MAWERFQYLCRATLANDTGDSVADCLDRLNAKHSSELYGQLPHNSLPMSLLNAIRSIDASRATLALKTYANLDATDLIEKPRNIKRLPIYLLWVVSAYTLMVSIYKFKIFPEFQSIYDAIGWTLSPEILFFIDHGAKIGFLLGLIIVLLLLGAFGLGKLVALKKDYSESKIFKRFCPAFVKTPYRNLIGMLRYPVLADQAGDAGIDANTKSHFDEIAHSGLEVDKEIYALFKAESHRLIRRCEIIAQTISIIAAIIVFFSVYQFVYGFYVPIFSLGATI